MSYQVLARKWRPRAFTEMVGQEHVLRALINGLDNDRLHHAYLFTGTRGVGKTTLARILAKCLNCDTGVSSTPCNQCSACTEIAEGRFVDLIEVDAASRTKVEDTRELLDNVQYAPSRGRYKVYLIDEVHMLSTHSFNALLKTLEEPPPHVKFLLATTDPQKLPVTILSRCLQFNLKNLNPERIVGHLKFVLGEEKIPFEESALWELGRAADGSMRDALSLTDQAIAHGGGTLTAEEVSVMLGTIDRSSVMEICQAVADGSAQRAMERVEHMADHAPDYAAALADMLAIWHQVAIAQTIPDALDPVQEHHHEVLALASQVSREDIQLFYQMTLLGRKDLPFAADSRSGFEMVLLRLLAFRPVTPGQLQQPPQGIAPFAEPGSSSSAKEAAASPTTVESVSSVSSSAGPVVSAAIDRLGSENSDRKVSSDVVSCVVTETAEQSKTDKAELPLEESRAEAAPVLQPESEINSAQRRETDSRSNVTPIRPELSVAAVEKDVVKPQSPKDSVGAVIDRDTELDSGPDSLADYESYSASSLQNLETQAAAGVVFEEASAAGQSGAGAPAVTMVEPAARVAFGDLNSENWQVVCGGLGQGGLLHNTAINLVLDEVRETTLVFTLDQNNSALYDESQQTRLVEVLCEYFGVAVAVTIRVAPIDRESPRMITERLKAERLQLAIDSLKSDPNVIEMVNVFGAELVESSVQPVD